jgi:delta 1-pyrroline-5-carboxylate dehydrogenase
MHGMTAKNHPYRTIFLLMLKLLHESIYQRVLDQLLDVYKQVKIGDPLEKGTLLGPLHTSESRKSFEKGIEIIKSQACCFFHLSTVVVQLFQYFKHKHSFLPFSFYVPSSLG